MRRKKFENCFTTALIGNAFFAGRVVLRLPYKGNLEKIRQRLPYAVQLKSILQKSLIRQLRRKIAAVAWARFFLIREKQT